MYQMTKSKNKTKKKQQKKRQKIKTNHIKFK